MTGKRDSPEYEPVYTHYNETTDSESKIFYFFIAALLIRNTLVENISERIPLENWMTYDKILSSHMKGSNNILISQTMGEEGYFSGIFAPHKDFTPRPRTQFWMIETQAGLIEYIKKLWDEGLFVYSLAAWGGKFGVFSVKRKLFGTQQAYIPGSMDISDHVKKYWDEGYMITSCCAGGGGFFIIMTKGVKGFDGKGQSRFTRNNWRDVSSGEIPN